MGYGYLYPRETDRVTWHFGGLELKNFKKKEFFWSDGWGWLFFLELFHVITLAERGRERIG